MILSRQTKLLERMALCQFMESFIDLPFKDIAEGIQQLQKRSMNYPLIVFISRVSSFTSFIFCLILIYGFFCVLIQNTNYKTFLNSSEVNIIEICKGFWRIHEIVIYFDHVASGFMKCIRETLMKIYYILFNVSAYWKWLVSLNILLYGNEVCAHQICKSCHHNLHEIFYICLH